MSDYLYQAPLPQGPVEKGQVILRDGMTAELRPVKASDEALLVDLLERVSQDARTHRFFGEVSYELGAKQLLKLGPASQELALIVLTGDADKPQIIAHGLYIRDNPEASAAEVAFLVDDKYQGKGLGTLLLERLALVAVRYGISHFYGPTEASNRQMRELFKTSGFPVHEDRDGGYVDVSFSILPNRESVESFEMRERIATVASIRPFFKPRGVAIIGASRDPNSIGSRILEYLVHNRFNGPVYPINPKANVVGSIPAYPNVKEVPGPVDLAVIAVPERFVMDVVDDCGKKGVRSLVIISAGFAETGAEGREKQKQLLAKARGYGMRIVGPNCLGLLTTDPEVKLNASFSPVFPPHGGIAMASHSGALGLAVLELAESLGLGLSSFVSLGNNADVSGNDLIQYWEDDPQTSVILLYLESFGNPRRFARLARRIGRQKPMLVVKAGRSQAGSKAASSHTAALAASETAVEALFHQAGIIRADTLEEMFDVAALLAGQKLPKGPRVAIVTNAGGPGILAVDALAAEGLDVPTPSDTTKAKLAEVLPPAASLNNPIDMIASANASQYKSVMSTMLADPDYDAVLVIFIPVGLAETEKIAAAVREAVKEARDTGNDKPVLACFMAAQGVSEELSLEGEHIPSYRFPESAAKALSRVRQYAAWRETELGVIPNPANLHIEKARTICQSKQAEGGGWLMPNEVDAVLDAYGLPIIRGKTASSPDEAVTFAEELGYPVVIKLASDTLVHKSEFDGVKLNLKTADEVRKACQEIKDTLKQTGQEAELDGYLVQPMAKEGVELMIGMTDDPLFGPLMVFGLGGIYVEVLRDVVFRITPLTNKDADEMVQGIRGYKLLQGYRGAPEADIPAVKDILLRISRLVEDIPEIAELDLNPLRAHTPGEGCTILDARIRIESGSS
ncbi:MAG: GNAT family N-acetyltransferase [Trueperaceae bacterium]|nr:GNAT family N-acetyltransferase [Trueperaceae bacterium]